MFTLNTKIHKKIDFLYFSASAFCSRWKKILFYISRECEENCLLLRRGHQFFAPRWSQYSSTPKTSHYVSVLSVSHSRAGDDDDTTLFFRLVKNLRQCRLEYFSLLLFARPYPYLMIRHTLAPTQSEKHRAQYRVITRASFNVVTRLIVFFPLSAGAFSVAVGWGEKSLCAKYENF